MGAQNYPDSIPTVGGTAFVQVRDGTEGWTVSYRRVGGARIECVELPRFHTHSGGHGLRAGGD